MFGFEKLEVWSFAIEYADCMYDVTRRFPDSERYGLISQMRRSAVSVSANVAEGSGRKSKADFARFLSIGYGSLMESVSEAHVAHRQQFLDEDDFSDVYQRAKQLSRMLSGLRASLERNAK